MGDENSSGSACIEPIPVVADDQIPLVGIQLMVQPPVFIFDGKNNFGNLSHDLGDEQCPFSGIGDAVAFQGNDLELGEFPGQQCRYIPFSSKAELPTQFKQVANQGDATGGMPQPPVQWGNQCGRSFYLRVSRD